MRKEKAWGYIIAIGVTVVAMLGIKTAQAVVTISDDFTIGGYIRTELDYHTGVRNPNNAGLLTDNYNINFFQTTLQTDLAYKLSEQIKFVSRIKFVDDSTQRIDGNIPSYDTFPTFKGDGTLLRWSGKHDAVEVRELYADITLGNLWLRLGKQQVVWGESDAIRLLDVYNPLDLSGHGLNDVPLDVFENIRVPLWTFRGSYIIPNPYIKDLTLEGILNPGDFVPSLSANRGSPFNLVPALPPYLKLTEESHRGDWFGGGRIYGKVQEFNFSLNYLYTFNQDAITMTKLVLFPPLRVLAENEHPKINIFGASFNYAIEAIKGVIRGEFIYTPDQPYESKENSSNIIRRGTIKYVLGFDRPTFLLPQSITPAATSIGVQYFQTIRMGDHNDLLINQAPVRKIDNTVSLVMSQAFRHDTIEASLTVVGDFSGAYWVAPGIKYKYGNHWIFDLLYNYFGGSNRRAGSLSTMNFANGALGRITWQF